MAATPEDILRYRTFISGTLVPTIEDLESQREKLDQLINSCREFAKLVNSQSSKDLPILVDVGEGCIVNAVVPDASIFMVDTGVLGVHVQMPAEAAVTFVTARANLLENRRSIIETKVDMVKNDLTEAHALLSQLQSLLLNPER